MALFNSPDRRKPGFRLALFGLLLAIAVIGLGAFTRLVHAGLGCPDWPTCYGHFWVPNTEAKIATANEKFPETPVETDKTWPEQIHRIFASTLGLVVLGSFYIAWRQRQLGGATAAKRMLPVVLLLGLLLAGTVARIFVGHALDVYLLALVAVYFLNLLWLYWQRPEASPQPLRLPAFLAGFVILQGLFGMWTVTLNLWPQVVTAHLLGGFTTATLLWLLALRCNNQHWQLAKEKLQQLQALRRWIGVALVCVVLQISLGGWTTSNYAALACHELPTCHNQEYWPAMDFAQGFDVLQEIGPNYLGGQMDNPARTAIHMMHRLGAIVTAIVLVLLVIRLRRIAAPQVTAMSNVVLATLGLQILLGLSNVYFGLPIAVAVAHNLVGALLLLVMVTLAHRVFTAQPADSRD